MTLNNMLSAQMNNRQDHLSDEISKNPARVVVNTRYGPVTGGRASTGAAAFLGAIIYS